MADATTFHKIVFCFNMHTKKSYSQTSDNVNHVKLNKFFIGLTIAYFECLFISLKLKTVVSGSNITTDENVYDNQ